MSRITLAFPPNLCELTILSVRRALGLDLSAMNHPDAVDGLRYFSRFTGNPCVALFERPGLAARLRETPVSLLAELDTADDFLDANSIALV